MLHVDPDTANASGSANWKIAECGECLCGVKALNCIVFFYESCISYLHLIVNRTGASTFILEFIFRLNHTVFMSISIFWAPTSHFVKFQTRFCF
jgi:hypothetical protein